MGYVPGGGGTTILNGSGAPNGGLGSNGNYYTDTTGGAQYFKSGGTWHLVLSSGSGGGGMTPVFKSVDYSANQNDAVLVDTTAGNITITLPAGSSTQPVLVKKVSSDTNSVIVAAVSGQVEGASTLSFGAFNVALQFMPDGTDWRII